MKIFLLHGQNRKGSTYHIARMAAEKLNGSIDEFFLPKDLAEACIGCFVCLHRGREHCPHAGRVDVLLNAMLTSDIIIIGSPTYCMEMSGQLKSFFDHLFTLWLSHRPEGAMFTKTAIVVSTAAGMGMAHVTNSLARQLFYLGIPKVHKISERVAATSWDEVKPKDRINKRIDKTVRKIKNSVLKSKPGIKLIFIFTVMRLMHKKNDWAPLDKQHWEEHNWLGRVRPWK